MAEGTVKSLKKAKTQINSLKTKMQNYAKKIESLQQSLSSMMKGDGTNAYWQGQNAYDWYSSCSKSLNSIIGNYKHSYEEFADFCAVYDKADAKSNYKGKLNKMLLSRFNGATYTAGVNKDMDRCKITTIPSTVNVDSSNDDATINSYRCYCSLKESLEQLSSTANSMTNKWAEISQNTTGKMSRDAKNRAKYMHERKKTIDSCKQVLETNYIGDILFR